MGRSYRECSIISNRFDRLLGKVKPARVDPLVKFLQRSAGVRYLVQSDWNLVDVNCLNGKIVGLFFMSLSTIVDKDALIERIKVIASAYNELSKSKKRQFEIVWIAKVDDYWQFHKYLKMMPWLAIRYEDSRARKWLYSLAKIKRSCGYGVFLFNRERNVFTQDATASFTAYGADWYPFTDTRIQEIKDEDFAIETNKSLKNLLGNATRDFVFGNDGTKVSISGLEKKVVGIYFCDTDNALSCYFTRKLLEVYSQLKEQGRQFEVVMAHIGGWCLEPHFEPDFKKMPWLTLPRADGNLNRLVRIFDPESDIHNCLVIVGESGSFVNKFGFSTVSCYEIEAYPFSRLSVAEIEKKKLEVRVKSLLTCVDDKYVIRKSGEKMPISYLSGKTILLLLASFCCRKKESVPNLVKWYAEIKEKHVDFEMILVASGYDGNEFDEYSGQMPWLEFPHTPLENLCSAMNLTYPTLAAFGPSAQLLSISIEPHFYAKGANAYPFSGKDVLTDMYWVVSEGFIWPSNYNDMHQ